MRQRGRDAWGNLRVYLGTDAETGRQRWATRTVHGSRREAQSQLKALADQAGYAQLRAGTVGELFGTLVRGGLACVGSLDGAPDPLDPRLPPGPGSRAPVGGEADHGRHLLLLRPSDAWRWPRLGRALAPGTVHRVHVVLHRALAQAVRWEWVWLNPASTASPPRVPPADVRPPGPPLVAALLDTVRDHHPGLHAYLCLAVSTGARRSQLLALRWVDIDEPWSVIGFQRALVEGPGGPVLQATKTHRTYRVELDQTNLEGLVAHRCATETAAREAGAELNLDGFVFSSDGAGSTPWRPNWVTKQFIAARRAANLSHFRLHDLRHFMATQMLTVGVPIATVAHRLSHAHASTTLNVYAHAVPGGDRLAAEALAAIVEAARVPPAPEAS